MGARRPLAPCRLALLQGLLQLAASAATAVRANSTAPACESGQELSLSLEFATNATGHRSVSARLEQPLESRGWLLHVEVGASACGLGGAPRRTLALALTGPPPGELRAPPPGYEALPGLGLYRAPPAPLDWFSARDVCRADGARLLVAASRRELEQLFVRFPARDSFSVWTGVSDVDQEGAFVTEDGVPLNDTGFAEFGHGQPNGNAQENCLAISRTTKILFDDNCKTKYPYICKIPL